MATAEGFQDRKALILYGTETGNAQEIAEEIERMIIHLRFITTVAECDAVSLDFLADNTLTVFVVATTGQGEFPSNARRFWTSLLRRKLSASCLAHVDFVVIGLGDSSYPKFNWAARKLQKRLKQLGAKEICESCEADEQGEEGTDGKFLTWSSNFRSNLIETFPLPEDIKLIPEDAPLTHRWKVEVLGKSEKKPSYEDRRQSRGSSLRLGHSGLLNAIQNDIQPSTLPSQSPSNLPDIDRRPIPNVYHATITENRRLTPQDYWQDVRLLSLTIPEDLPYYPGDALAVTPKNLAADVSTLLELMSWDTVADIPIKIIPNSPSSTRMSPFGSNATTTLRTLILNYLDILAIPRRSFFSRIAAYTTDAFQKDRLLEFADPKYLDDYYDYATRPRRSILEVLAEFNSVKIPWQDAVNVLPVLRPRQFSIASGGPLKLISSSNEHEHEHEHGTRFELLVAIVRYRTVIRKIREGVCTRYLANLAPGNTLDVSLRTEGRFHGAQRQSRKEKYERNKGLSGAHILIGAGTGLAPLRSLTYEKKLLAEQGSAVGSTTLFFGCRNPDADFFLRDEDFAFSTTITTPDSDMKRTVSGFSHDFHLITAFSRNQKEKIYVQDRIREHAESILDQIHRKHATVIICGSSGAMPRAVREALVDVLATQNGHGDQKEREGEGEGEGMAVEEEEDAEDEARRYLAEMEKGGRLKEETW